MKMDFSIPESLAIEHEVFNQEIVNFSKEPGMLGEVAKELQKLTTPHFAKENKLAFRPLGVLQSLAEGKWWWPGVSEAYEMIEEFKSWVGHLLEEHKQIAASLEKLIAVSPENRRLEYVKFAERLLLHAKREEEVLFPMVMLMGEYLKIKLHK